MKNIVIKEVENGVVFEIAVGISQRFTFLISDRILLLTAIGLFLDGATIEQVAKYIQEEETRLV